MINKTIKLIIIAGLLQSIIWATSIPIWQFPDEQAHFAQVQNYAELKGYLSSGSQDLSYEIFESERILGTLRDKFGRNKFTYNPEFNIEYSTNQFGLKEKYLNNLPFVARTTLVATEATSYPPLFYVLSALGYFSAYQQNLFFRVIATRFISVAFFVFIIWFSYKFSQQLFPQKRPLQLATTIAVAFHPMLTFVSSGINNDTLLNLLATILLYFLIKIIRHGLTSKDCFFIALTFTLGTLTKQFIYLFIPSIILALILAVKKKRFSPSQIKSNIFYFILGLLATGLLFFRRGFWWPFWPKITSISPGAHLTISSLINQSLVQLYREALPWYWGVYKWLGVVLPLNIIRAIKIIMVVSLVGLTKFTFSQIKTRQITSTTKQLLFLLFTNFSYTFILIAWNISLTRSMGFGHGLQGRYFFPLIASHMAFLVLGLWQVISSKLKQYFPLLILVLFLTLQLISLHRVFSSYYALTPIYTFINQISQYKPMFAKWPYYGVYWGAYLLSLTLLLIQSIIDRENK